MKSNKPPTPMAHRAQCGMCCAIQSSCVGLPIATKTISARDWATISATASSWSRRRKPGACPAMVCCGHRLFMVRATFSSVAGVVPRRNMRNGRRTRVRKYGMKSVPLRFATKLAPLRIRFAMSTPTPSLNTKNSSSCSRRPAFFRANKDRLALRNAMRVGAPKIIRDSMRSHAWSGAQDNTLTPKSS